jgi:leucyl-tRNA synthetase
MTENQPHCDVTTRARSLRTSQTTSEGLLWSVLRAKQLCGLKFRRQHPIKPWIVDFACPQTMLVVEIDGGYHDNVVDDDLKRQEHLEALGWKVIRFTDKEVEEDAEAVARAIARELNLPYQFKPRTTTGSGMKNNNAPKKRRT